MTVPFQILYFCLFCLFTAITWIASRRYGQRGTVGVHVLILFLYMLIVPLALAAGHYEYDGVPSVVGIVLQVFLVNCLLLPIAIVAIWKRRRAIMRQRAESMP
jgi:O-antigen ligase